MKITAVPPAAGREPRSSEKESAFLSPILMPQLMVDISIDNNLDLTENFFGGLGDNRIAGLTKAVEKIEFRIECRRREKVALASFLAEYG